MKKRIGIQGLLIACTIIAFITLRVIFPNWQDEELDEFLDVIGIGIILLGFLFRISARGYKEEKSAQGWQLVIDGPYALVRNPMYFGAFLIGVGFIALLTEWWTFFIFFAVYLSIYIPQIKKEEKILAKQFNDRYLNYCRRTPAYFPRFSNMFRLNSYLPMKLSWIKKELSSLIVATSIILAVETWEDSMLFGRKESLEELVELILTIIGLCAIIWLLCKVMPKRKQRD